MMFSSSRNGPGAVAAPIPTGRWPTTDQGSEPWPPGPERSTGRRWKEGCLCDPGNAPRRACQSSTGRRCKTKCRRNLFRRRRGPNLRDVSGTVPYPESPFGAGRMLPAANPLGSPLRRVLRHVLPGLFHLLALVLMVCPSLPETGPLPSGQSLAGPTIAWVDDDPALANAPKMARMANDADDLRDVFAVHAPGPRPTATGSVAMGPARADEPRTREDHPPVRPPRHRA